MSAAKTTDDAQELKLLREFAHEVRTPLTAMLGFSGLLQQGENAQPPSQEIVEDYAERMNTATRRLLQVCERVLDEALKGSCVVRKEDIDFHSFCPEIIRTFEIEAQENGLQLNYSIANDFPVLHSDPVILYEIMSNLISNSIKFTPKGGMVSVKGEADYKNNGLILVVQDTGKGIPTTILMSLMKGGTVTTSYAHSHRKGWGQGIQFVQEKVKLLGGSLEIESAMGGGTVACIRMPAKE